MSSPRIKKLRRLNVATHRDLGYFFSSLIIIYCISGLALNHINDWNPDFIISKKTVSIGSALSGHDINKTLLARLGSLVGESRYKVYDIPVQGQLKIYYDNASLHVNFDKHSGIYEKVERRPLFYQSNVLHRNSLKGWKWVSDIFAIMLIIISVTGLFILKGKHGIGGRGQVVHRRWPAAPGHCNHHPATELINNIKQHVQLRHDKKEQERLRNTLPQLRPYTGSICLRGAIPHPRSVLRVHPLCRRTIPGIRSSFLPRPESDQPSYRLTIGQHHL